MISKEEIIAAKEVDLQDIVEGFDVPIVRSRDHIKIHCLWHEERTPSLAIYSDHYHCYSCGERGDILDFIQKYYSVSFAEAVNALNNK